jgi:sulfhydrogenase subunit beta (sulfur reductase)
MGPRVPTSPVQKRSKNRREGYKTHLELDLPEILEMEYHSKVWDEFGSKCLSCGSCSMVCPTCYCFDVCDETDLGSRAGRRIRSWDSCLLNSRALVAGQKLPKRVLRADVPLS